MSAVPVSFLLLDFLTRDIASATQCGLIWCFAYCFSVIATVVGNLLCNVFCFIMNPANCYFVRGVYCMFYHF